MAYSGVCCDPTVLNSTCSDFHYGTALHIAASNLCLGAVKCLLEHGANPSVRVTAHSKSVTSHLDCFYGFLKINVSAE